jgi:hypothetical protein
MDEIPHSDEAFKEAFEVFFDGVKTLVNNYYTKNYPNLPPCEWKVEEGTRYCRIVHDSRAFAFVDKKNGDVLKPASWKTPAKHARGNIYDDHSGLGMMGPYGPAYLR